MTDVVDRDPQTLTPHLLAAWAWHRQGLDGSAAGLSPADILTRHGWARSVGGSNPYMTLHARAATKRTTADQAVADLQIHELPSARGCAYVLGAEDFALALQAGRDSGAPELRVLEKLGVERAEVERLADTVHATLIKESTALDPAALDPAALKKILGDAVRSLGEEGKKKGASTTLPAALGLLQRSGRIRRVPVNGRLDQQRFAYTAWNLPASTLSDDDARTELLRRYLRWTGGATLKESQWFTGFTVAQTKKALAALTTAQSVAQFTTPEGDERFFLAEDAAALSTFEVREDPQVSLLSSLDALVLLRRNAPELILDPAVAEEVLGGGSALSADLNDHPILDRGIIIGMWQYDSEAQQIVSWLFPGLSSAQRKAAAAEVARVGEWIAADLGDFKSMSLDSIKSRRKRIDYLREQSGCCRESVGLAVR